MTGHYEVPMVGQIRKQQSTLLINQKSKPFILQYNLNQLLVRVISVLLHIKRFPRLLQFFVHEEELLDTGVFLWIFSEDEEEVICS